MKRIEDMTQKELQDYIHQVVTTYLHNEMVIYNAPFHNVSNDIINQLINYSRN